MSLELEKAKIVSLHPVTEGKPDVTHATDKAKQMPAHANDKPAVFRTVNCNMILHNGQSAPLVAPKFKISRGTQVNAVTVNNQQKSPVTKSSPPVPAKPSNLIQQTDKSSPPRVPPKPAIASKPQTPPKPALLPKPSIPPKPVGYNRDGQQNSPVTSPATPVTRTPFAFNRDGQRNLPVASPSAPVTCSPVAPIRSHRLEKMFGGYASPTQLLSKPETKSSSLGRLEGIRCRAMLQASEFDRVGVRNQQRDSGFVSSSWESVEQSHQYQRTVSNSTSTGQHPVAPPRRRRKSAESCIEPIYAVVDFSKKANRRQPNKDDSVTNMPKKPGEQSDVLRESPENKLGDEHSEPKISISPPQGSEQDKPLDQASESRPDQSGAAGQMRSDIHEIENSYARISTIIESFLHKSRFAETPVTEPKVVSKVAVAEPVTVSVVGSFLHRSSNATNQALSTRSTTATLSETVSRYHSKTVDKERYFETNAPGSGEQTAITARLVFSGTVIEKSDLLPVSGESDVKTSNATNIKEFKDAVSLPQPTPDSSPSLDLSLKRESSPTLSSISSCSSSSSSIDGTKDREDILGAAHFNPDMGSAGTLGDVDTSDATRSTDTQRSSVDSLSSSAIIEAERGSKERRNSFGLRRTLDNIFSSLNKSGARKAGEKRMTTGVDGNNSSSTDAEQPPQHLPVQRTVVIERAPLCATRTEPSRTPASRPFNRVARKYRSALPAEKVRASSLDGQMMHALDSAGRSYTVGELGALSPVSDSPEPHASSLQGSSTNLASCTNVSSLSIPATGSCSKEEDGTSLTDEQCRSQTRSSIVDSASEVDEDYLCDSLEGKEKKAYLTAKEIASSERVFVDCLHLICIDFRAAVAAASMNSREGPVIPEAELNRILSYLPHLRNLNEELLNDFELRLKRWAEEPRLADVIVRKGPFLKLYSAYIRDFQAQSAVLDECVSKYPRFGRTLKLFEQSERCKGLSLKHFMLKPVQRLPQYRLLLEAYLRNLNETSLDYRDTVKALKVVTEVAEHANNSMKDEDNFQKLLRLQSRLGDWEIIKPGRCILKEGELNKVSRKHLQPRYFILLNDCLLYTSYAATPSAVSSLKLHNELPLNRMEINLPTFANTDPESATEFSVISTARSFTLSAPSTEIRDEWMTAITDAISQLQSKQSSFPTKPSTLESNASRLGQQAPVWIPDSRVTMCQLCAAAFSITYRRHHCRACGKVVCRSCSSHNVELEYLKFRSARVCDDCYATICGNMLPDVDVDSSNCSSTIEPDVSAGLATVPSVCYVHAFSDDRPRAASDIAGQTTGSFCVRGQQTRLENIRKERPYIPARLIEVPANDSDSQMSGYLSRRVKKSWKRNWFVLKDRVLYIYKASEDVLALDTIPVLGYNVQTVQEEVDESEQCFQLFHPKQAPMIFQAESVPLAKKWMEALSSAVVL